MNWRALGVIPARGGSKRLPRKNVQKVAGHPLIAHTIMAAAGATLLSDWLVSSEDDEILEVAARYGAPVYFKRPEELSGDNVRNIETVHHALEFMEDLRGRRYDVVVLLQPTCPIRKSEHIDQAVGLLADSDMDTLASVKGPFKKRDPILKAIRDDVLMPYCQDDTMDEAEPFYVYNASIYAAKRDYFMREHKLISRRQMPLIMDRFCSLDVDEEADLVVAEAYFGHLAQIQWNEEQNSD